jgi:hypothetical protein
MLSLVRRSTFVPLAFHEFFLRREMTSRLLDEGGEQSMHLLDRRGFAYCRFELGKHSLEVLVLLIKLYTVE